MCGISGALVLNGAGEPLSESLLAALNAPLGHRGPDGSGVWLAPDRRVGFAHRRLAIVDLSPAARSRCRTPLARSCVTYNGEIYNHAEIRARAEARGHRFRTDHSDTEVILHAYRNGASTACAFPRHVRLRPVGARRRRLWLVRDRIGVKPLYYAATRPAAFRLGDQGALANPDQPRAIDEEATFFHYFSSSPRRPRATTFRGHRKTARRHLAAGRADGRSRSERYWDAITPRSRSRAATTRSPSGFWPSCALRAAAQGQRRAGRGFLVRRHRFEHQCRPVQRGRGRGRSRRSGSATIRTTAATRTNCTMPAATAEFVGAEHHEIRLSAQDFMDFLPRMVELQDEPIGDPVCVPLYYVSKLARDNGVIVARSARAPTNCSGATQTGSAPGPCNASTTGCRSPHRSKNSASQRFAPPARSIRCLMAGSTALRAACRFSGAARKPSPSAPRWACSRRACASGLRAVRPGRRWNRSTRATARTPKIPRP